MKTDVPFSIGDKVRTGHGWAGEIYAIRVVDGTTIYDVRHESGYPSVPFLAYELTKV